jgi:hypothetical protein
MYHKEIVSLAKKSSRSKEFEAYSSLLNAGILSNKSNIKVEAVTQKLILV